MTSRQRSILIAAAATLASILLFWSGTPEPIESSEPSPLDAAGTPGHVDDGVHASPGAVESSPPTYPAAPVTQQRHYFAVAEHEIAGLPPGMPLGTRLELWVTWDKPLTKTPRLQRLDRDVVLEDVVPPDAPNEPSMVLLSVRPHRISDLLWAERYGALSAVLPEPPA